MEKFRIDLTTISLITANIITIILAIVENWEFSTVIWIYYAQSIIIGFFHWLKIINAKEIVITNMIQTKPRREMKIFPAVFFPAHYGIFHIAYLHFLLFSAFPKSEELGNIFFAIIVFFINHLFSYKKHVSEQKTMTITKALFYPYVRIIPIHLIILISFSHINSSTIIIFLVLKTIADTVMHMVEHKDVKNRPQ